MALELKEYQTQALDAFERWLEALREAREDSAKREAALRSAGLDPDPGDMDFPRKAWERLADSGGVAESAGHYVARTDGAGRPIPHACLKVPTGGGKTLLAAAALERMSRQTGLALWVTPTRAIYRQTKDALWSREHPYRQTLERASGGRVKTLEKDDRFTALDVEHYLCVMLLMLPAANRRKGKEFLRMFRDSGRYSSFFPDDSVVFADYALIEKHPDLERWPARERSDGPVKQSLFNVFKMLRPVVVLDEAHKAYGSSDEASAEFVGAINRLDPSLVVELSATPHPRVSNLLVDISGVKLKDEEMIKLPVQVTTASNVEWRQTLTDAAEGLERLEAEARALEADEGRYVRPIAVVRVERTGKDQRDGERVHAEDARAHLTANLGVPPEAVRVKSAENDELGREDLLSPYSPVRWVITKAALMEGWDCPFAYTLVMLDNTQASRAITQLAGRVMRMPHARRTGREALDQCYVYCWNAAVETVVQQVKSGLENEGLTGLGDEVRGKGAVETKTAPVTIREQFRGRDIFLPLVLHKDGSGWRELDYDLDILPEISWGLILPPDSHGVHPSPPRRETASVDVGGAPAQYHAPIALEADKTLSVSWFARRLADVVPNPWQAARIAQDFIRKLRDAGLTDEAVYDQREYQASALRRGVFEDADAQAQGVFKRKLREGTIRFDLKANGGNYRLREQYAVEIPADGEFPLQTTLNLYEPVFDRQFDSDLERKFARYLDQEKALRWWHRVAARQRSEYHLRGWRRDRIYPDFVAFADEHYGKPLLFVFETKGEHMRGSSDTEYKRRVLELLQVAFNGALGGGSMHLQGGGASGGTGAPEGTFRLVFSEDEFPEALANLPPSAPP